MPDDRHYEVIRLDEDGAGIIDLAGGLARPERVPGAVPGDIVRHREGGGWQIERGPHDGHRPAPLCPHYPACGGCTVQHMADDLYARWKASKLFDALLRQGLDDSCEVVEPLWQAPVASRRRAVLTARHEAGQMRLGFHAHRSHDVVDMTTCAVLRPTIVAALPALRGLASLLARAGECRLTVLDTGGGLDVAIGTERRRRHDGPAVAAMTTLAGEGRILRLTVDDEPLVLRAKPVLDVGEVGVVPPPGAFVQAAAAAEVAMARIAIEAITNAKAKRVADLFCGLGAFTFAMARQARVLAVDSDRPMVEALAAAARHATGLKPIEAKVRDLFKDPLSPRELDHLDAVVFDPPRAGARAQADALARSKVRTIVAVSCNPATLARDLGLLVDGGYRLERVVPIDQFLFTPHLEAVAVLRR